MITTYFKPTNYCNIGCDHCYLTKESRADSGKMTDENIEKTALFLSTWQKQTQKHCHVIWHGGEPLILPAAYFEKVTAVFQQHLSDYSESIQTSLIPLKLEHLPIIKKQFHNRVGVSFDFQNRTIKGDPLKFEQLFLQKISILQEHKVQYSLIITPTLRDIEQVPFILDWCIKHHFHHVHFERYTAYNSCYSDRPNNQQHSQFLINLFDDIFLRIQRGESVPMIDQLRSAIGGVLYDQPGERWGGDCQSSFVVIEPNGNLNTCPDRATRELPFGMIHNGFQQFETSPSRKKWIRIQSMGHNNHNCLSCENYSWCKSGCPINPHYAENDLDCGGFKFFLNHVRAFLLQNGNQTLLEQYYQGKYTHDTI